MVQHKNVFASTAICSLRDCSGFLQIGSHIVCYNSMITGVHCHTMNIILCYNSMITGVHCHAM